MTLRLSYCKNVLHLFQVFSSKVVCAVPKRVTAIFDAVRLRGYITVIFPFFGNCSFSSLWGLFSLHLFSSLPLLRVFSPPRSLGTFVAWPHACALRELGKHYFSFSDGRCYWTLLLLKSIFYNITAFRVVHQSMLFEPPFMKTFRIIIAAHSPLLSRHYSVSCNTEGAVCAPLL